MTAQPEMPEQPDGYDPDSPQELARRDTQLAWFDVRQPQNESAFYAAVRFLIAHSHQLDEGELRELAEAIPLKRLRGRPEERERRRDIFLNYFTFVGTVDRGGKMGDPLPSKSEAIADMKNRYRDARGRPLSYDTARKLYDSVKRDRAVPRDRGGK